MCGFGLSCDCKHSLLSRRGCRNERNTQSKSFPCGQRLGWLHELPPKEFFTVALERLCPLLVLGELAEQCQLCCLVDKRECLQGVELIQQAFRCQDRDLLWVDKRCSNVDAPAANKACICAELLEVVEHGFDDISCNCFCCCMSCNEVRWVCPQFSRRCKRWGCVCDRSCNRSRPCLCNVR